MYIDSWLFPDLKMSSAEFETYLQLIQSSQPEYIQANRTCPDHGKKFVPEMWTDSTDYAEIKDKLNKVFHGRKQVRFSLFLSDCFIILSVFFSDK